MRERTALLTEIGLARAERDALDRGHMVAFQENPALRPQLENSLGAVWSAVDSVNALVTPPDRRAPPELGAGETYERYAAAVAAVFRYDAVAAGVLDALLRACIAGIVVKRWLVVLLLIVGAAMIAAVAYLGAGFYAAIEPAWTGLGRVFRAHSHDPR
jgi:hypothetical protein